MTVVSALPLIAGMIIWRDAGGMEDPSEKNVKNLASQLLRKSPTVLNEEHAIGDGVIAIDGQITAVEPRASVNSRGSKQDALMLSYKSILKLADENNKEIGMTVTPIQQVLNTNQQTVVINSPLLQNQVKGLTLHLWFRQLRPGVWSYCGVP